MSDNDIQLLWPKENVITNTTYLINNQENSNSYKEIEKRINEHRFIDLIYLHQSDIDKLCNLLQDSNNIIDTIWIYNKAYRHINNLNNLFELLKTNNKVEELKINDMKIKDLKPICEMLKVNKSIIKLDLQYNWIKDVNPLIDVVLNNDTLETINLKENYVENFDLTELEETIEKNNLYLKIIY